MRLELKLQVDGFVLVDCIQEYLEDMRTSMYVRMSDLLIQHQVQAPFTSLVSYSLTAMVSVKGVERESVFFHEYPTHSFTSFYISHAIWKASTVQ